MLQFAAVARKLSRVWLCGEAADPVSERLQNFLLHGGVYGSTNNYIALRKSKESGWLKYLCIRVFAPYAKLKTYYPILDKHRWLMPVMQIRRWLRLLRPNALTKATREAVESRCMEGEAPGSGGNLLEDLGLESSAW